MYTFFPSLHTFHKAVPINHIFLTFLQWSQPFRILLTFFTICAETSPNLFSAMYSCNVWEGNSGQIQLKLFFEQEEHIGLISSHFFFESLHGMHPVLLFVNLFSVLWALWLHFFVIRITNQISFLLAYLTYSQRFSQSKNEIFYTDACGRWLNE